MNAHPETTKLVAELRDSMVVSDDMLELPPDKFWEAVRQAKRESFGVAVVLLNFLIAHGQYTKGTAS